MIRIDVTNKLKEKYIAHMKETCKVEFQTNTDSVTVSNVYSTYHMILWGDSLISFRHYRPCQANKFGGETKFNRFNIWMHIFNRIWILDVANLGPLPSAST